MRSDREGIEYLLGATQDDSIRYGLRQSKPKPERGRKVVEYPSVATDSGLGTGSGSQEKNQQVQWARSWATGKN